MKVNTVSSDALIRPPDCLRGLSSHLSYLSYTQTNAKVDTVALKLLSLFIRIEIYEKLHPDAMCRKASMHVLFFSLLNQYSYSPLSKKMFG